MTRRVLVVSALSLLLGCSETVVYEVENPWENTRDAGVNPGAAAYVLVTNSGDDTLSWIDLETREPVLHVPVGRLPPEREGPHHGAAFADGSAYFVGLSNFVPGSGSGPHGSHGGGTVDGYLLKYDAATQDLIAATRVDRSPGDVRLTPDERYVVQSHFDLVRIQEYLEGHGDTMNSRLAIVDAETMEKVKMVEVCPAGHGIAIAPDSRHAYVACWGSDELAEVTLEPPWEVKTFKIGDSPGDPSMPAYGPYAASISPVDGTVWVSCLETGDVRIFDPETETWDDDRGPIVTGGAPFFGSFVSDGSKFLVPHQGDNALSIIDPTTGDAELLPLPLEACEAPHAALVLPPDETHAIVVCEGNHTDPGTVAFVRLDPMAVDSYHEVGVYPDDAILLGQP